MKVQWQLESSARPCVTAMLPSSGGKISLTLVGDCEFRLPSYIAMIPAMRFFFTFEISGDSGLGGNDS